MRVESPFIVTIGKLLYIVKQQAFVTLSLAPEESVERPRDIIHLDMDAFYAAVEVLDDPSLSGKPVIVGGARERGVVSAASYEARRFGVHSAQPISRAMHLCPHGVYLPVRMSRYKEISERTFEIFRRYTPLVEPLSIDEAFLDVSGSTRLFGNGLEIAKAIRREVRKEIGLTVSAGVAPSKFRVDGGPSRWRQGVP